MGDDDAQQPGSPASPLPVAPVFSPQPIDPVDNNNHTKTPTDAITARHDPIAGQESPEQGRGGENSETQALLLAVPTSGGTTGYDPQQLHRRSRLPSESAGSLSAGSVYYYDDDFVEFEPPPDYVPRPPDGGWGWMIVLASFFCNMVVDGICYTVGVLYVDLEKSFPEVPVSKMAWIGSLLSGMYLCVGPIVSSLTNRFGCRPVTIAGGLISSFCFLIAMFSPSIEMLILTYGVFGGIGFGLIYLPAIVSVGYYFEKKRAFATGIAVCGSGVGTFVFGPLTKYLLDVYGWRGSLAIFSGIILNTVVMGALMRPLPLPKIPKVKPLLERIKEDKDARMRARSDPRLYRISEDPAVEGGDYNYPSHELHDPNEDDNSYEDNVREEGAGDDEDETGDKLLPLNEGIESTQQNASPNRPSFSVKVSGTASPLLYVSTNNLERCDAGVGGGGPGGSGNLSRSRSRLRIPITALMAAAADGASGKTDNAAANPSQLRVSHRYSNASTVTEGETPTLPPKRSVGRIGSRGHGFSHISLPDATSSGGSSSGLNITRVRRKTTLISPTPPLAPSLAAPKLSCPSPRGSLVKKVSTASPPSSSLSSSASPTRQKPGDPKIPFPDEVPKGGYPGHEETAEQDHDFEDYDDYVDDYNEEDDEGDQDVLELSGPLPEPEEFSRPLYKKDIFYSGSVTNLPEYRSQPDARSYYASVTSIPVQVSAAEGGGDEGAGFFATPRRRYYFWHDLFRKVCPCLGKRAADTLTEMTDFGLFRNHVFLLVCLSNVFAFAGFYVPFVYIVGLAQQFGIEESRTTLFISIIGAANIVGRLAFGYLTDLPFVDSLLVNNVCMVLAGVCTILCPFCAGFTVLAVNLVVFGLSVAAFISLTSIILVDLIGLDSLTNAFGLLILFRGITSIIGPPLAGWIRDTTGNYNGSFYVSGAFIVVAGLISFALRPVERRCRARTEKLMAQAQAADLEVSKTVGGASPYANGGLPLRKGRASFKKSTMSISASSQILRTGSNSFAIRPSYVAQPRRRHHNVSQSGPATRQSSNNRDGKISASELNIGPTTTSAKEWGNGEAFVLKASNTSPKQQNVTSPVALV